MKSGINILASGDDKRVQTKRTDSQVVSSQIDLVKLTMHIRFYNELKH